VYVSRRFVSAGKKINRPVANYDYCHNVFNTFIATILVAILPISVSAEKFPAVDFVSQ
jgi:hypothetical protein